PPGSEDEEHPHDPTDGQAHGGDLQRSENLVQEVDELGHRASARCGHGEAQYRVGQMAVRCEDLVAQAVAPGGQGWKPDDQLARPPTLSDWPLSLPPLSAD